MAVYVDDVRHPYGKMIMCHLWADTEEELFGMVDAIGVNRKWVQRPPKASWLHFDISLGKKAEALNKGAILTDKYGPSEFLARREGNQRMLDNIAAARKSLAANKTVASR